MKPFKCIDCDNIFDTGRGLANHRRYGCSALRAEEIREKSYRSSRYYIINFPERYIAKRRELVKLYSKTAKGKEVIKKVRARQREKNPKRMRAMQRVWYAIKTGKLTKGICECGESKVEGHHYKGYDFPLDVKWLCHKHHMIAHNRYYEGVG